MPLIHVWFSTKQRKWLLQGEVLGAMKEIIHETAERHSIKLIECEAIVDHVHLLLDLPQTRSLPRALQLIKDASAREIFLRMPELKLDAETESFWQDGYNSKLIPNSARRTVSSYIRTQWDRLEKYER